ncbi:MAG: nitroreductase family deazaflavin-dependent oxidoreductase [Anaerolineales bacterium]|nr:nitroreductase family deazaflavin-dependent oxidoreductase [Anaerolineales bacterium]
MHEITVKPRPWHPIISQLAATPFGIRLLSDTLHRIDKPLLRLSRNRTSFTSMLAGLPVVVLTTTGAKSGLQRHTPLVALAEGDRIILIASYFGSSRHPAWYHNLRANPRVRISYKGQTGEFLARVSSGEECEHFWQLAADLYPGYQLYQQKAGDRQIPVVVLEPL